MEVDAGKALEELPEEALGVVLPDLLPRHRLPPRPELLGEGRPKSPRATATTPYPAKARSAASR